MSPLPSRKTTKTVSAKTKDRPEKTSTNGPGAEKKNSSIKVPSLPRDSKADALRRLGVSPEALNRAPNISGLLRETKGGLKQVIAAMRFSSDPIISTFFAKYDSLSEHDRNQLSIEAVCISAAIEPTHLLGSALLAIREHSVSRVKIIAISNHPDLMEKRIEFAKLPGGSKDRDAIDTALGFLPSNRSTTNFINKIVNTGSDKPSLDTGDDSNGKPAMIDDVGYAFPDASEVQNKLSPMRQRLLAEK
jgi:hypothetical protein